MPGQYRYGTDAALRQAWADTQVSLESAEIPPFRPGRFPMRQGAGGSPTTVFYDLPSERNWVDFSAYMSDITVDRILQWARIVLVSRGAFNDPKLWNMLQQRNSLYAELYDDPYPYTPDVGLIVDEESKLYVKDDWDANWGLLYRLRDSCAKAGAAVGYYLLDDFVAGLVPQCRVYVFANACRLTQEEIGTIRGRLDDEEATALWIYAAGCIGPERADPGRIARLTGIEVAFDEGELGAGREIGVLYCGESSR